MGERVGRAMRFSRWQAVALCVAATVLWPATASRAVAPGSVWAAHFAHEAYGVAVDDTGNVYVTGRFGRPTDFDPGPGVYELSADNSETYFAVYDAAGGFVRAGQFRDAGNSHFGRGEAIAVAPDGGFYVGGWFEDTVDFDPSGVGALLLTSTGGQDGYLVKLDADGGLEWATIMGDRVTSLAVDE